VESNWRFSTTNRRIVPTPGDYDDWLGETEVLGENLSQRYFVHHKPRMLCPDVNPGRRGGKPATNNLSYGHGLNNLVKFTDVSEECAICT
jgi:hypothetical protein